MQKQNESGQLPGSVLRKGVPHYEGTLFYFCRFYLCQAVSRKAASWLASATIILLLSTPAYSDDVLQEINTLAKSGTPGLALQVLDRHQPDPHVKTKEWMQWERRRIDLYAQQNNWDAVINRLALLQQQYIDGKLPELPETCLSWMQEKQAIAYININQGEQALAVLRELIWGDDQKEHNREKFSHWRRLVIKAYLASKLIDDAYTAMLRYQQDYQNNDHEWDLLRAHVMLQSGRAEEAARLLSADSSHEGRALYYLASLKSNKILPSKIYKKSSVLAKRKNTPDRIRQQLWVVAATAAQQQEDWRSAIEALSHVLLLKDKAGKDSSAIDTGLFSISSRQLWSAYFKLGKELGNQAHLLMGNDKQWQDASRKWRKKGERQNARALLVVLARQSNDTEVRLQAHENFSALLLKRKHGLTLLRQLYLDKELKESSSDVLSQLPDKLRYMLIDDALARSDIITASQLMGDQVAPPEGVDALMWELRRARLLVMGGKYRKGVKVLHTILENNADISDEQLDRYVQVLFDLQTIGAHKEAIALFESLPVDKESQHYREVLFWMADSNKALKQYEEAARQYLQSAIVLGDSMDPWAQTARYQAADMLVKAGLREDAKHIYKRLLKTTKEPARRAAIQSRIQQLWLKPVSETEAVSVQEVLQ